MSVVEYTVLVPAEVTLIGRQAYGIVGRVYTGRVPRAGQAARTMRVGVDIYRNTYDFQSHYRAQVWTDDGWKLVTEIASMAPEMCSLPHAGMSWERSQPDCTEAVEAVAERLVDAAYRVLSH